MWVGSQKGATSFVDGEPDLDTNPTWTFPSTAVPLRAYLKLVGATTMDYNGKTGNIVADPLGATPFED